MKRITVDLTKASTETLDLTSVLNPRVGDGQLSVPLHIIYGTDDSGNDDPVDMRDKDIEFLSQDTNKNDIYVSGTVTTNSKGDDPYNGNVTFVFPEGTFKVAGTYDVDKTMFRIINKADKIVLSTVNVKLNVLEGGNSDYNFDPNKTSYNSRLEDMLKLAQSQMKDKIANADKEAQAALTDAKQKSADIIKDASDQAQSLLDGIKQTSDEAKGNVTGDTAATAKQAKQQANDNAGKVHDLQGEVSDARGRFMTLSDRENKQDFNIDRKEDKSNANDNYAAINLRDDNQDLAIASKASQHFITDYLSHLNLNPTAYRSLDELTQKYPDGDERLAIVSNKENTFFAYWDSSAKAWARGANLVDPDKIHFDEILESFHNYIPNPSFNGIEMPGTSGTVTQKIVKKDDQNWLHLETTGIGGIYWLIDPTQEADSYFPKADKQFSLVIVNNDTKSHVITADIHITNADTNSEKDTVIVPGASIEALPGKPTIIKCKYPIAENKPFINNNYQMFVYDQTGDGSFDLKEPKLTDFYQENTTDFDGLVNPKSFAEPLKGSKLELISYMNQAMYHLKLDTKKVNVLNTKEPEECGLSWYFRLSDTAYSDQTPLILKTSLINRNSYNAQKITLVYQELDGDGNVDLDIPIGTYVLLPNGSIDIHKPFSFGLNKVHPEGRLVITANNPKEVDLYVSADIVLHHVFSKIESSNLFGDYLTMGRGIWGGDRPLVTTMVSNR